MFGLVVLPFGGVLLLLDYDSYFFGSVCLLSETLLRIWTYRCPENGQGQSKSCGNVIINLVPCILVPPGDDRTGPIVLVLI